MADNTCKMCGGTGRFMIERLGGGCKVDGGPCYDCDGAGTSVRVQASDTVWIGGQAFTQRTPMAAQSLADAIRKLVRDAENNAYVNGRQDEGEPCPYCNHRGADRANEHEVIKYGQSFSVDSLQTVWQCRSCKERWTTNEMEDVRQAFVDAAKVNYLRGLARAMEIAENEPELPGPIPEELRAYDTEHLCRSCVRTTKRNIADAIKAEMEKGNAES